MKHSDKKRPTVLAINGSPRKDGNTTQLLGYALGIIEQAGIETEYIDLVGKRIDGCISCRHCRMSPVAECSIQDDFAPIFQKVVEADGLILGSPVYFGTSTGKLTCLLERLGMVAEGREAIDRPLCDTNWTKGEGKGPGLYSGKIGGAIVSTRRTGGNFVLAELQLWFSILHWVVVNGSYWTVALGGTRIPNQVRSGDLSTSDLSKDQLETDKEGVKAIKDFAVMYADVMNRLWKTRS
ncbi:flavodoxin family protein [Candidatus Bipolaricaulota bacterium]